MNRRDLLKAFLLAPFATGGGVIGAPTYFPLPSGGVAHVGECGPEAIIPLCGGGNCKNHSMSDHNGKFHV